MNRPTVLFLFAVLAGLPGAQGADNGIFVAEPKLYDDYTLEKMLLEAEQSLAAVQLIEANTISAALGATQGVQVTQTQLALTATQLPTPQIVDMQSGTPSTQTTTSSVTPAPPQLPALPPLTPPSTVNPSAMDKLDEFLQLKLRVSNLRLLLRGSLTDQVSLITVGNETEVVPQSRFTFGFPVSLVPPAGRLYRDAIAEVEVKLTLDQNCAPQGRPGLKMVLPQEKTYNVARLQSSSTSIGTGIVTGAFSVGGNWLRGQSKLFLVQDQDTLAYEGQSDNSRQIVFGWRFKPVLGQRKVQPSLQQLFAQLTFPLPPGAAALGQATVTTRWRLYERKTGALGRTIPGTERMDPFDLRRIDLAPGRVSLEFLDLGSGGVRITLKPAVAFFEGTTFRLGGGSPIELLRPTDHMLLDLAPLDVARQGVLIGVRGENERELVAACNDLGELAAVPQGCEVIPSAQSAQQIANRVFQARTRDPLLTTAAVLCGDQFSGFKITQVTTEPVGQSTTRVKVTLDKLKQPVQGDLPFLTILGDKVFGLRDAPYETYTPGSGVIEFVTENATLEKAGSIEVVRLLWGPDYRASLKLDRARKLTVTKHMIVSEADGLLLALEGQALEQAVIKFPDGAEFRDRGPGHAVVFIPAAATTKLKHLALQADVGGPLVLVDISKSTPPPPPPVLNPADPVKIGTGIEVTITWKNDGEIQAISHSAQVQTLVKSTTTSATIRLADALTVRPGKVALSVKFKDGTELPLTLQIVDQQIAVVQQ